MTARRKQAPVAAAPKAATLPDEVRALTEELARLRAQVTAMQPTRPAWVQPDDVPLRLWVPSSVHAELVACGDPAVIARKALFGWAMFALSVRGR